MDIVDWCFRTLLWIFFDRYSMESSRVAGITPRTQNIQGLLWKLKRSITGNSSMRCEATMISSGSKWRKKFIQADNAKLVQWHVRICHYLLSDD